MIIIIPDQQHVYSFGGDLTPKKRGLFTQAYRKGSEVLLVSVNRQFLQAKLTY